MDELQQIDRTPKASRTRREQTSRKSRARRSLLVPLIFAIVAICLGACAVPGKTEPELSASPFGQFEPQAALLVGAEFVPGEWRSGTPAHCPYLMRVFITSDVNSTEASLIAKAERLRVHPDQNGDFGVRPFSVAGTQVEWLIFPMAEDDLRITSAQTNETAGVYRVTIIVRDRSRAEEREPGRCRLPLSG